MITPMKSEGMVRVTVTLDPVDVDLLDRLAALEDSNRSAELRGVLEQLRPMMQATVQAFEVALANRGRLDDAATQAAIGRLSELMPHVEKLSDDYLGFTAAIEGSLTADPRRSNHGGHTPTPTHDPTPLDDES